MILQALVRLAKQERLEPMPGYWREHITWIITIAADGTPLRVNGPDLRTSISENPKAQARVVEIPDWRWVPAVDKNNPSVQPDGPVGNAQRLFGWLPKGKATAHALLEAKAKRDAMRTFLGTIAPRDRGMRALFACLDRVASDHALLSAKWGSHPLRKSITYRCALTGDTFALPELQSELISFRLDGDEGLIVQRTAVQKSIAERDQLALAARPVVRCLVQGDLVPAVHKHPQVSLFPGTWISLVSCSPDHAAFQHYGRIDLENAPIGAGAARAVGIALTRLVANDLEFTPPGQERPLPQRHLRLSRNTLVLYWCEAKTTADPLDDPWMAALIEPHVVDPTAIRECFEGPWRSTGKRLVEQSQRFHALILGRNNRRAVVRGTITGSVGQVAESVRQWLDDLAIEPRFPSDRTGLRDLVAATTSDKSRADPIPDLAARIYGCAVDQQRPIPAEVLGVLLTRIRSPDGSSEKGHTCVSTARVALIKATLNRGLRLRPERYRPLVDRPFPFSLESEHPNPAYQLGRLFSLMERIRYEAINQVNASFADRHLGSAMGVPFLTFPNLLGASLHHLAKVTNRGRSVKLNLLLGEIRGHLRGKFPRHHTLEEQGAFILGYYHQRAEFFRKTDDATQNSP